MTDINDLDRHIGRYVDLEDDEDAASGFLIDVTDEVDYTPDPARWVAFDWGRGFRVSAKTTLTFPGLPEDDEQPQFSNPVRVMHLAMHDEGACSAPESCTLEDQAVRALRAFRIWRLKQTDVYWESRYVKKVRVYAEDGDSVSVGDVIRDAVHEGAPPHMIDRIRTVARRSMVTRPGEPEDAYAKPDADPWASKGEEEQ